MSFCTRCGRESRGGNFCTFCGEQAKKDVHICSCGTEICEEDCFCSNCGKSLNSKRISGKKLALSNLDSTLYDKIINGVYGLREGLLSMILSFVGFLMSIGVIYFGKEAWYVCDLPYQQSYHTKCVIFSFLLGLAVVCLAALSMSLSIKGIIKFKVARKYYQNPVGSLISAISGLIDLTVAFVVTIVGIVYALL